jgi:hypothetical protein
MEPDDLAFYPKAKMNVAGATISGMILWGTVGRSSAFSPKTTFPCLHCVN